MDGYGLGIGGCVHICECRIPGFRYEFSSSRVTRRRLLRTVETNFFLFVNGNFGDALDELRS